MKRTSLKKKRSVTKKPLRKGRHIGLPLQKVKTITIHKFTSLTRKKVRRKPRKTVVTVTSRLFLGIAVVCFIIVFNLLVIRIFPVTKDFSFSKGKTRTPVEITIKTAYIDLPIYPARFTNGSFETTTKGASYLTSSPVPGETGNSIIYAHNWWNLFGNLYNVKKGEKIEVTFNDKTTQNFTVTSTQTVPAKQVSILRNTTDTRLTLFTCTDFLDADRFVVTAMAD